MNNWSISRDYISSVQIIFQDLNAVFLLQGEKITKDPLSNVIRVEHEGLHYYVKRYYGGGKGLRFLTPFSRIKTEWKNLRHFKKWGIPTANIVAFGLDQNWGVFQRGALITAEISGTQDLANLVKTHDIRLTRTSWVNHISQQLAEITRCLHQHNFAHNDLKWRNLLVDSDNTLFLIDCPTGGFWFGPFLRYRIIKDLACLDKVAQKVLSNTQRLKFYLQYKEHVTLTVADKQIIKKIICFFEGRE